MRCESSEGLFPLYPGSLERFLRESGVTLHPCKVEGPVHPIQVKFWNNCFATHPKKVLILGLRQGKSICWCSAIVACVLPVSEVAGVVDPHEFIETAAPPSGQLQSHMEGLLRLGLTVPPEEPVTLNLRLLLLVK